MTRNCISKHYSVVIVGAGPVGLLLANFLGNFGIRTLIVDKKTTFPTHSMAIGITPPSMEILRRLCLTERFIVHGVKIEKAYVHGSFFDVGSLKFHNIGSDFRFILSLPQAQTIEILAKNVQKFGCVDLVMGRETVALDHLHDGYTVRLRNITTAGEFAISARFLIGCDGHKSTVRNLLGIDAVIKDYGLSFLMADFADRTVFGNNAHLFFTSEGAVESFPLPNKIRRWIIQTRDNAIATENGFFETQVNQRTGCDLRSADKHYESTFKPKKLTVTTYFKKNGILCGDACHVMSPIGGHGMNTGFADAEFLALVMDKIVNQRMAPLPLLKDYEYYRSKALAIAVRRTERAMWLGTRTGTFASTVRNLFIKLLLTQPFTPWTSSQFSMLSVPFCTVSRVPIVLDS